MLWYKTTRQKQNVKMRKNMQEYFQYGDEEIEYLKSRDKKLGAVIDKLGHPNRPVNPDLFFSVVDSIVGQQISTKAHATVKSRMLEGLGEITPATIDGASVDTLQSFGMTFRKAEYIKNFAQRVVSGEFDLEAVAKMPDAEVTRELVALHGIGEWTAEMILLHCLQRPNVLSFGDLAILRGMRMVYRHREIDRARFEKYRRRLSPHCSVASIYFWKVSAGAIPELTDPAPAKKKSKRTK
jgi:DNA-3-methyladenine glycosylase II